MATANWHEDAFFGLHYDLHPNVHDTELGRETTYEHIRSMLERVGPDFVQYDCKGHPGWAGYPTRVGSASPGIVTDALRVWRQVTRDLGIPLSVHYSGVWDTRAVELHPDWACVGADGTPSRDHTDPLSGYRDTLLIPQLIEVIEEYDIDGVWVDGENWASRPCWSDRCIAEFRRRTGIENVPRSPEDPHWHDWLSFHRDLFVEHVTAYADALHAKKPTLTVCSNWMYSVRQPGPVTAPVDYLSGDFDFSFGADRACAEARFLSGRGMSWDLMAWGFLKTGDQPWTMKTLPHLCQEVSVVLAQGGAVFIYNQPQRSGRLTEWHQDLLAEVARFCRKRQVWCHKTETVPQVAVLHSQTFFYRHNDPLFNFAAANQPMEGALHALLETGYSVDVLDEDGLLERIESYPLVVIPEQEGLPGSVVDAVVSHVKNGGRALITGTGAAAEWPAGFTGVVVQEGQRVTGRFVPAARGSVPLAGDWPVVSLESAVELAPVLTEQEPELNRAGVPAATLHEYGRGKVVVIHGPVFRRYYQSHYPRLRQFIGDMTASLDTPSRLMRLDGPSWIEMAARKRDNRLLIQFVNRASTNPLGPHRHMVEEVPQAGPFSVHVPMASRPSRCYMAPDDAGLEWEWADGVLHAQIGDLYIHNVLVIE